MSAPSATVERAALAPCWFCGALCPLHSAPAPVQCLDSAACFARQCSPPGGPLSAESAAMLRAGIESGRAEPLVYLGSFAENNEEEPIV